MRTTIHATHPHDPAAAADSPHDPAAAADSPKDGPDARRLRFAATWHRRNGGAHPGGGTSSSDPTLRPAYPEPIAAPEAPPAGALHATVEGLTSSGDGETLILCDAGGRRLHFFREGLFRWSTRTATDVLLDGDVAPGPAPRRLWVRRPGNGTWWTDSAVCHIID
ncbi:hypothetical protein ACFORJ_07270 [Corynebacterium hansenii]|uniref:Uncharacterized protein n=1 Tax=Corynebacterium hansenii TaxID=394964 RepID=A0ABV7ZQ78_9CORY|nr:hypothetical protein [Corynebacterium hansenii]WJZ00547.1 hypothetical protein CHAN_09720 [Corynebacterium hansenii]